LGNGYCTENHESHYQTRLGAFKQTGQHVTVALKEDRGKKKKIKTTVVVYGKEHYKQNPLYT
jgi:hypothetical protein